MTKVLTNDPRRTARIMALQAGFAGDLRGEFSEAALDWLAAENPLQPGEGTEVMAFAQRLLQGIGAERQGLDELIQGYAPAWPVSLLSPVDRNILRIALFELLFHTDTPAKTAVNEAVELAKVFGSDSSARFVNGVLGSAMGALSRGELNPVKPVSEGG